MIQDLFGQSLAGIRESVWPAQARMALVLHALSLRTNVGSDIDFMLELLMDSLVRQFMLIQQEQVASIAPSSVQECAGQLARAWFNRASTLVVEENASGDLHTLQRRNAMRMKLADGPIQVYLAHQIHIMDLLAYIAVGERQEGREAVRELLRRSLERRARQAGSLEQAVEAHRAMLSLWKIRIDLPPAPQMQPGQGEAP
jgi:hypothetical protein